MALSDVGPDGVQTFVQLDTGNRVSSMRRGPEFGTGNGPVVFAEYSYDALGLLSNIAYGSGGATRYSYDEARRVTQIKHRNVGGTVLLQLDYTQYTADDLPQKIEESGLLNGSAVVTYTYDHRRRLTHEVRERFDGGGVSLGKDFDLAYTYDAGGNRTVKTDATDLQHVHRTEYHYDLEAPATYGSNNNRLMFYKEFDTTRPPSEPGDPGELVSTTWYFYHYNDLGTTAGNPERVVTKRVASTMYESVYFRYALNGRTVSNIVGEQWEWDGVSSCETPDTYELTFAYEFRYDGARQRYLTRALNPATLQPYEGFGEYGFTDYDGDQAYGDYYVPGRSYSYAVDERAFEPGMGRFGWSNNQPDETTVNYYHTDHLGTIRGVTDFIARWGEPMAFTAFGERKVGTQNSYSTRFGYVGSFGYQAHWEFPFLHVGARYYDPATGRFLQRDPIGIRGGLNVYAYVFNRPTVGVDPTGKGFWGDVWSGVKIVGGVVGGIVGGALIGAGTIGGSPIWVAGVGVVIFVGGTWVAVSEIVGVWDTANKVVDPIRPGVKRRNKAVDDAMNCYPSSG